MYTLTCILVLFSIYCMAIGSYVPQRIKRRGEHRRGIYPQNARRGIIKMTDKIKYAITEIRNAEEQKQTATKSINLNDFFNNEGMLFLSQPEYNEVRTLNKALNKALALKQTGAAASDVEFSSDELQVLEGVVAGLSGVRRKDERVPGMVYNFNELVA